MVGGRWADRLHNDGLKSLNVDGESKEGRGDEPNRAAAHPSPLPEGKGTVVAEGK